MPGETIETVSEEIREKVEKKTSDLLWHADKVKDLVLVNCWYMSDYESVAMWKLYSKYEDGVAIRTTYGKLKDSFEKYEKLMHGGAVRYIDIKKDKISFSNSLAPFTTKRLEFSHEKELRMVVQVEPEAGFDYDWTKEQFGNGKLIPCDTNLLIDAVFVSPKHSADFKEKVQQILIDHGINVQVQISNLNNIY